MAKVKFKYGKYDVEGSFYEKKRLYKWNFNVYEDGILVGSCVDYYSQHASKFKAFEEWWNEVLNDRMEQKRQEPKLNKTAIKDVYMLNGDSLDCGKRYCHCGDTYYFSDQMLKDSLYIQKYTISFGESLIQHGSEIDEEDDAIDVIELIHVNDIDVIRFVIYADYELEPIQQHHIIKDIYDLYKEYALDEFFEVVQTVTSITAKASEEKNSKELRKVTGNKFSHLKQVVSSLKNVI